jgi:hypothetical protein
VSTIPVKYRNPFFNTLHSPASLQLRTLLKKHGDYNRPSLINRGIIYGDIQMYTFRVGFEVLMVVTVNITVLWDVMECSQVETCRQFRGKYCLHFMVKE